MARSEASLAEGPGFEDGVFLQVDGPCKRWGKLPHGAIKKDGRCHGSSRSCDVAFRWKRLSERADIASGGGAAVTRLRTSKLPVGYRDLSVLVRRPVAFLPPMGSRGPSGGEAHAVRETC